MTGVVAVFTAKNKLNKWPFLFFYRKNMNNICMFYNKTAEELFLDSAKTNDDGKQWNSSKLSAEVHLVHILSS